MRIAVIGTGKTGRYVKSVAKEKGHEVVGAFDIDRPFTEATDLEADCAVDFSVAKLVPEHVRVCGEKGINLVIGTTGWYDHLEAVRESVEKSGIGCLYAPNFALGVNLFFRAVEYAAKLYGTQSYDIAVHEEHHTGKADAPSGTALELGKLALQHFPKKKELLAGNPDGKIGESQLHISSSRIGDVTGNHNVIIEGSSDRIELKHSVKSRRIFAESAIAAAEWLAGRTGLYSIHDMIDDILKEG